MSRTDRAQKAILNVLAQAPGPLGASRIVESLRVGGFDLSPRAVRFHLLDTDRKGWTRLVNRRAGRSITNTGREALDRLPQPMPTSSVSGRIAELL